MRKQAQIQQKQAPEQVQVKSANVETDPLQTAVSPITVLQRAYADPNTITPNDARVLQRTIGNQAVRRLIIQRKMTVGPVGDKYEQEADAVAKQVVSKINTPQQDVAQRQEEEEDVQMKPISTLQRQEEEEEVQMKPISTVQRQEEEEEMQMKPISTVQRQEEEEDVQMKPTSTMDGGDLTSDVEGQIQSAKGGGRPLDSNTQSSMGQAFNADFSGVNIHTNGQSDTLNRSLQARAFTSGQDIFFRSGEYSPNSSGGQELLAHELTHVVQQNGRGNVQRQPDSDGISVNETAPNSLVSLKKRKTHLDFIRVKKKDTHIAKMMLSKIGLTNPPDDAYGHWWIEIGDKTGGASQKIGSWTPVESYGWWPSKGVNIKETFGGVPGELNRGGGSQDPHHGDDAKTEYYPVKMVDDQDDYDTVRNEVVNEVRQFATGFKGSWNWRFGWGKNCHTFLDRLKKKTHLHHQKGSRWLLRPEDTPSMKNKAEAEEDEQRSALVFSAIQGTGFEGLGDDTLEYFDTSLLTSNIGLGIDDYQGLDEENRTAILGYLDVSAESMNTYLRYAFGDEWTNEFT